MRQIIFLILAVQLLSSCNEAKKSNENRVDSSQNKTGTTIDTLAIDKYVSSLKAEIPKLNYKRSLQYSLGDYKFDVSVYYKDNKQVALFEDGHSGEYGYRRLNVYLQDEKPIFAELAEKVWMGSNNQFTEARIYFYNSKVFKALERKSTVESKLQKQPFKPFIADTLGFAAKANFLKNALDCSGVFDLPFLEIKKDGDKEYMVLGKMDANSYKVNLQIIKEDEQIRKIKSNPDVYKGKKMDIHWAYENLKGYERLVYKSVTLPN